MTDKRYLPEGARIGTAENTAFTATVEGLRRAMAQHRILEGIALVCDCTTMRLTVDLGGTIGVIDREEAVYSCDGSTPKDIAIITRVGKPVCFQVIGLELTGARPIAHLSRRAAQKECMENFVLKRTPGDIIPARVTHLEPFGAFVDIGCGIVSLITVDSISVSRIAHPRDRFTPGDSILAVVKSIDPTSGRITMTHRELLGTWEENAALFSPAQTVPGIVRSVEPYGVFIELTPNLAGLAELREDITPGSFCAVYIKSIIPERMKIKLVIVDPCVQSVSMPMQYFIGAEQQTHLRRWQYSPASCARVIETVFDTPTEA